MLKKPTIESLIPHLDAVADSATIRSVGEVEKVVGLTIESMGPQISLGDLVSINTASSSRESPCLAEVIGFRDQRVLLMPIDGVQGIRSHDRVTRVNGGFSIHVGEGLMGRVVDGICRPLDGQGQLRVDTPWEVHRKPPNAMSRPRIHTQFHTGIRAIDGPLPCGKGQRVGIFAGSGIGKSTLLGMICRNSEADVNVIALIGERGKEVRDFIEESLGEEGLRKSVVVVVTSDRPALQRVKGAETAMAIAEYFRDEGLNVFFVMDSLTRYAMAQREIGLAAGEPPATKGYPPSVFALLPRLLERAGTSTEGTITAFCTVLVEGDDMNDPVADTVRGLADGHIVLSRELAMRGHYPPIDVRGSVSRVVNDVVEPKHTSLAQELRKQLDVYTRAEDLITIGAYRKGTDAKIDRAVNLNGPLNEFLCQEIADAIPPGEAYEQMKGILSE